MIKLRDLTYEDLETYRYWKLPIHKYHEFNGPYFAQKTETQIDQGIEVLKMKIAQKKVIAQRKIIVNSSDEMIGEVSYHWKSIETYWMEIGIVIFNDAYWGKGIGYRALTEWVTFLFNQEKEIVRLGLTTWSGNQGMISLAEKLGFKKEAHYRKARVLNGIYYDSVSYGVLREEWEELISQKTVKSN